MTLHIYWRLQSFSVLDYRTFQIYMTVGKPVGLKHGDLEQTAGLEHGWEEGANSLVS